MADLADQLLAGNRRALAQTITRVEDDGPEAHAFLARLYPHTGRAHVIGVTGAPGTGKSTLVNALARTYRAAGQTVGFLLAPVGIGEVMALADQGERMPQKSTFFHPKLGTGLVFNPLYP